MKNVRTIYPVIPKRVWATIIGQFINAQLLQMIWFELAIIKDRENDETRARKTQIWKAYIIETSTCL